MGDRVDVRANGRTHNFVMAGDLPGVAPGQELAVIDIASAQWRFGRLGTLDRVDVKLKPGTALGRRQGSALIDFACQHSAQRCRDREPARRRALARLSRQPRHARTGRAADRRVPRLFGAITCSHAAAAPVRAAPHARPAGTRARRPAAGRGCSPGRCGRADWFGWRLCDRRCRVAPGRWRSRRRLFRRRDNDARVRARSGGALLRLWRRHRACRKLRARPARRPDRARAGA